MLSTLFTASSEVLKNVRTIDVEGSIAYVSISLHVISVVLVD